MNLGEVVNLEHDYNSHASCTCGSQLSSCRFWSRIKAASDGLVAQSPSEGHLSLTNKGTRDGIDKRGGLSRLITVFVSTLKVYPKSKIDAYINKSKTLFTLAGSERPEAKYLVDLSKSPERLELLLESEEFDVRCLYLDRDSAEVYASTMARPKLTRAKFGFKPFRESLWLAIRRRHMERIYAKVSPSNRKRVDWNNFLNRPKDVLEEISSWLDIEPFAGDDNSVRDIDYTQQHIYVGNRWLFSRDLQGLRIEKGAKGHSLTPTQKVAYKLFN